MIKKLLPAMVCMVLFAVCGSVSAADTMLYDDFSGYALGPFAIQAGGMWSYVRPNVAGGSITVTEESGKQQLEIAIDTDRNTEENQHYLKKDGLVLSDDPVLLSATVVPAGAPSRSELVISDSADGVQTVLWRFSGGVFQMYAGTGVYQTVTNYTEGQEYRVDAVVDPAAQTLRVDIVGVDCCASMEQTLSLPFTDYQSAHLYLRLYTQPQTGRQMFALRETVAVRDPQMVAVTPLGNQIFTQGEACQLAFHVETLYNGDAYLSGRYEVRDHLNRLVDSGEVTPAADGSCFLDVSIDNTGWYKLLLHFTSGDTPAVTQFPNTNAGFDRGKFLSFAIVPPVTTPNAQFGVDVASTGYPGLSVQTLSELAYKTGAGWVRERISPNTALPTQGSPNFSQFQSRAAAFQQRGLGVLSVFQSSPPYSLANLPDGRKMTDDLFAIYDFAKYSAQLTDIDAFEIWNEHDITAFGDRPPDHVAAIIKAASLGYAAGGGADAPLRLLGPFARDPGFLAYGELLFQNGIAPYLDAYSFHTYEQGEQLTERLAAHQTMAETYLPGKPMWLSETGRAFASGGQVPDFDAANRAAAYSAVTSSVQALRYGVDRSFLFILRPYISSGTQFGMLRSDHTPFAAYAAYAALCHLVTDGFSGDASDATHEILLFGDTAVVYSRDGQPHALSAGASFAQAAWYDVMGNPISGGSGMLVGAEPIYVVGADWGAVQTPQEAPAAADDPASDVVLFSNIPDTYVQPVTSESIGADGILTGYAPRNYQAAPGEHISFTLAVYNFSEETREVALSSSDAITLAQDTVTVPPMQCVEVSADFAMPATDTYVDGVITATADGQQTAPSRFRVCVPAEADPKAVFYQGDRRISPLYPPKGTVRAELQDPPDGAYCFILASYVDGVLADVCVSETPQAELTVTQADGCVLRTFVWNSLTEMKPIA